MNITRNPEDAINNTNSQIKKRRKKTSYKKISNETRQRLVEMVNFNFYLKVYMNDFLLKDAAKILNMNYSTAKTILRIFRIEKRIEKKNAEEEKQLKNLVSKILTNSKEKNKEEGQMQIVKNLEFVINGSKENFVTSATGVSTNEQKNSIKKNDSVKEILKNLLNEIKHNENKKSSFIYNDFVKVLSFVDDCYKNIKNNQLLINILINSFYKINHHLIQIRSNSKIL